MRITKENCKHIFLSNIVSVFVQHLKLIKVMGFEFQLKTSNEKQNIVHTILGGNDVNVTVNKLYLYIPNLVSSPEQKQVFIESFRKSFIISFASRVTDRKPSFTDIEYQLDVGSASNIKVISFFLAIHQKIQRDNAARPSKKYN